MYRTKILSIIIKYYAQGMRIIKASRFFGDNHNMQQFHSGGEDYNPPANAIPLCVPINENPGEMAIIAYVDKIVRTSSQGEKIIYSTNIAGSLVTAFVKFDNTGNVIFEATGNFNHVSLLYNLITTDLQISTGLGPSANLLNFNGTVKGIQVLDSSATTPSMETMRALFNTHTHGGSVIPDQQM